MTLFSTSSEHVPRFRRTWRGYDIREVDRFLDETAEERRRLHDALARVERLLGEWQDGPEAILAAAHRDAERIRATAAVDASQVPRTDSVGLFPSEEAARESIERWSAPDAFDSAMPEIDIKPLPARRLGRRAVTYRRIAAAVACSALLGFLTVRFKEQPGFAGPIVVESRMTEAAPIGEQAAGGPDNAATATGSLTLTLSASRACWVRTVVDGAQEMERLLQPGETLMLHALDQALLKVGDAAAITLLINNRPTKALGGEGQVVTRLITRANYTTLIRDES